jgi:RNAse (barnase) inhibitor barstar
MTEGDEGLPVLVVDGALFSDLDGFASQFSTLFDAHTWHGNLDAFNDILRGGFGTPGTRWVLRWINSDQSRGALGHEATARWLEQHLVTCHPANREHVQAELDEARRGTGPTLFDRIVDIIRDHGPDGSETDDAVVLKLT